MITINLLLTGRAQARSPIRLTGTVFIALTCLSLTFYGVHLRQRRTSLRVRAEVTEARLADVTSASKRVEATRKRHADLAEQLTTAREVLERRGTTAALFEAVRRSVTDEAWLTELRRSSSAIQIDGRASSLDAITELARNLGDSFPFVTHPEIRSLTTEAMESRSVLRFQIAAEMAKAGRGGRE